MKNSKKKTVLIFIQVNQITDFKLLRMTQKEAWKMFL